MRLAVAALVLLASCSPTSPSGCVDDNKTRFNGEEWIEAGTFLVHCSSDEGSYGKWQSVKTIACLVPDYERDAKLGVPVRQQALVGRSLYYCKIDDSNRVSMGAESYHPDACRNAKDGTFIFNKFVFECEEDGQPKAVACIAAGTVRVPVGSTRIIYGNRFTCKSLFKDVILTEAVYVGWPFPNPDLVVCIDRYNVIRKIGSWWVDKRVNKTCGANGVVATLNSLPGGETEAENRKATKKPFLLDELDDGEFLST